MNILITITGCKVNNKTHEVIIYAQNNEWKNRCYNMRRDFDDSYDIEYHFDTTRTSVFKYLTEYLKEQKATQGASTYGEALAYIIGTTIQSPNLRFCNYYYKRDKDGITEWTEEDKERKALRALREFIKERKALNDIL